MEAKIAEMGPVLALDTSGSACSAALYMEGSIAAAQSKPTRTGHSELLIGMVDGAMQACGLAFGDLARIAVTIGPGSFTGVRIGLATARGLAVATGRPAIGFTTLEVTAAAAARDAGLTEGTMLRVITDARRGEVYWQDFRVGAPWHSLAPLTQPMVSPLSALPDLPDGAARTGSGLALFGPRTGVTDIAGQDWPSATALAMLGAMAPPPAPGMPPRPLYLRAPDAKLPGGRDVPAAAAP